MIYKYIITHNFKNCLNRNLTHECVTKNTNTMIYFQNYVFKLHHDSLERQVCLLENFLHSKPNSNISITLA